MIKCPICHARIIKGLPIKPLVIRPNHETKSNDIYCANGHRIDPPAEPTDADVAK